MLSDNIRNIRKVKGYSQEELAVKLNVVRQTVSKWEKGLSVPDSDILIKMAEIFEIPVSELLGAEHVGENESKNEVCEQLQRINEQLAIRNRRSKTIMKVIICILVVPMVLYTILAVVGYIGYSSLKNTKQQSDVIYEEMMIE